MCFCHLVVVKIFVAQILRFLWICSISKIYMSFKGNKQAGTWQVRLRYHRFLKSSVPHLALCLRGVKHSVYVCVGEAE